MYLSDSLLILLFVCSVECQNVSDENKDRKVWGEREKERKRKRERMRKRDGRITFGLFADNVLLINWLLSFQRNVMLEEEVFVWLEAKIIISIPSFTWCVFECVCAFGCEGVGVCVCVCAQYSEFFVNSVASCFIALKKNCRKRSCHSECGIPCARNYLTHTTHTLPSNCTKIYKKSKVFKPLLHKQKCNVKLS